MKQGNFVRNGIIAMRREDYQTRQNMIASEVGGKVIV
jgi:hypothetical protein